MPLSDEDIREILRLIDESDVDELRVETEAFSLHVRRGGESDDVPTEPVAVAAPSEASGDGAVPADLLTIPAPMLGTFYRAEAPGAAPFVGEGSRVEADTVVCLIEVMKMMNSIPAGVSGTIVEVCAENAELVEYGAPLFRVRPEDEAQQ
jgi:acetyl-CoA carboxylase biotin carboxyl carrier protein